MHNVYYSDVFDVNNIFNYTHKSSPRDMHFATLLTPLFLIGQHKRGFFIIDRSGFAFPCLKTLAACRFYPCRRTLAKPASDTADTQPI